MSKLTQELDKLRILVVVAEKSKINEAAKLLHLTQPSISRSIQKLEEAFGIPVFIRSRDGVKLTEAGKLLYEQAVRMLRELDDIQIRAQNLNQVMCGNLTVGSYDSLAEYLWPEFLMQLEATHPNLNLSIKTSLNDSPLIDLASGKIDLLVDAEPQTRSEFLSFPLYSDKFSFFVAADHKGKLISPADARSLNIIFAQKAFDENHITIEEHLKKHDFQFSRQYCFDSFSTAKRLAMRGMGIAVLPKRLAEEDCRKKIIKPILLQGFDKDGFGKHSIYATMSRENDKNKRLKNVIALLKNHFKLV